MNNKTVLAWYFSNPDDRLRCGDNRLIVAGETLAVDCEPILCQQGLHASAKLLDALKYALSCRLWRVRVGGTISVGNDKIAGTQRKALWPIDADHVMRQFSRQCALDVIHLWDAPLIVRQYLETGDETLRHEAWDAARDAAWATARATTWAAARATERATTWAAAWATARATAWAAAWATARDAAWDAERDAAWDAAWDAERDAAWAAARDAAWDAERAKQNERLTRMIFAAHKASV